MAAILTDELINKIVADADKVAAMCVGAPEQQLLLALWQVRENIKVQLSDVFGADMATLIAEAFVTAVHGRKAELESIENRGRLN